MRLNERQRIIKDALELSDVGALVWDKRLASIRQNELFEFFSFRLDFIAPMVGKELATMQALKAYEKIKAISALRAGHRLFNSVAELEGFARKYFAGEALANGGEGSGFMEHFIIIVDSEGELRNQNILVNGAYERLNADEVAGYYNWLLANQHKIGDIKRYAPDEVKALKEAKEKADKEKRELAQQEQIALSQSKKANPNVACLPLISALVRQKRVGA